MKKSNKQKGLEAEKRVQRCINSGALWFDKGDLKNDEILIDVKQTNKKGFRITKEMLEKIWEEALDSHKFPKMVIVMDNDDGSHWYLAMNVFKEN